MAKPSQAILVDSDDGGVVDPRFMPQLYGTQFAKSMGLAGFPIASAATLPLLSGYGVGCGTFLMAAAWILKTGPGIRFSSEPPIGQNRQQDEGQKHNGS